MYTLSPLDISNFDVANAPQFVEFWSQFYNYHTKVLDSEEEIDYVKELRIGNDLTEESARRLLRWKDPHQLTHRILRGRNAGKDNPRVVRTLNNLKAINQFRNSEITEDEMKCTTAQVFRSGVVFRVFLMHIAKPHIYPIADENVFRACSVHTRLQVTPQTWQTYTTYCDYFRQIAGAMGVAQATENIHKLKRIDNALMEFGKFLKAYYRH